MSARLHPTQEELRQKHGTPQEFAWTCDHLFHAADDAMRAIEDYNALYLLAGGVSGSVGQSVSRSQS